MPICLVAHLVSICKVWRQSP